MLPFELTLTIGNEEVPVTVEQLERFADVDGYTRYDVRTADRRSVWYVNVVDEGPVVLAYDDPEVFTADELRTIAGAIREYNREAKVVFAQFLLDF
jgi:hypothetical protein